jgi:hypothetical protein
MPDSCSRTSEITYKVAWMKDNEKIVEDAIALWTEMGALQQQVNGKQRAKMLCVVAYDGEKLIGVSTTTGNGQGGTFPMSYPSRI